MAVMPEGSSRRLVAFSDSRQSAATLANGVEIAQWRSLMSNFILQELKSRASGGLQAIKSILLDALKANDSDKVTEILTQAKEKVTEDELEDLLDFRSAVKNVLEDGDLASAKVKQRVGQAQTYKIGYVRIDDFLNEPDSRVSDLPPIWRRLSELGVNPAGSGVDAKRISTTDDWTALIRTVPFNGRFQPQIQGVPLSPTRASQLKALSFRVNSQAWQAISGRLLYDLGQKAVNKWLPPRYIPTPADSDAIVDAFAGTPRIQGIVRNLPIAAGFNASIGIVQALTPMEAAESVAAAPWELLEGQADLSRPAFGQQNDSESESETPHPVPVAAVQPASGMPTTPPPQML
jgi:hypothetical protein